MALDILIVDDEADIRTLIAGVLEDEGYAPRTAAHSDAALACITERRPALVLLDVWLKGSALDGLELLEAIKQRDPSQAVLMISGHGNLDTAVAAVRRGAVDFIQKPFKVDHLLHLIARATETEHLKRENAMLKERVSAESLLLGQSNSINAVRATLKRIANMGSRVLLSGPAGVGKEVAARLLHNWSPRALAPFIVMSAARMLPERMEEELFGLEDAQGNIRPGLLEMAHGGTLFLDEISDMPLATQGRILRVLTDQQFTRIGGTRLVKVDVRVVTSTARDLNQEIAAGRFREDLYYRLNVVPIHLPPLVERKDDIKPLVEHFLARFAQERRVRPPSLSQEALAILQAYEWPGNVRQLRNIIERTILLAPENRIAHIEPDMLPMEMQSLNHIHDIKASVTHMMSTPLREAREVFEREYLRVQIHRFDGNISRTASFIGMERSALHRKLKSLGFKD
jgi:two-component system, NtrC family, nitrogen regulation response regulator NtrX